jgi:glyoxylase-like metal-dependent hydrolase (beta-lactamase superfamily II)
MIFRHLVVGPLACNCYIVGDETTKQGMVIDPGAEGRAILRAVSELGLSIKLIVVTHAHFDHVGAVPAVKEATGAQLAIHEADASMRLGPFARMMASISGGSFSRSSQPERLLRDGDVIEIDSLRFTVLHTPGHSLGGISLYGHGMVFTGDTLFNYGVGRSDFPGCSHRQLIDSIKRKLMSLPDDTIVYPGHGPPTTIGEEKRGNPFL